MCSSAKEYLPFTFPHQNPAGISLLTHMCHMSSYFIVPDFIYLITSGVD